MFPGQTVFQITIFHLILEKVKESQLLVLQDQENLQLLICFADYMILKWRHIN